MTKREPFPDGMGGPAARNRISEGRTQCEMLSILARMEHYAVSVDRACGLVVAQRTPASYQRIGDIETCFRRIEETLSSLTRRRYRLLVDARVGPSRNDPTFEAALAQHRGKLLFGFERNAALMATATGRLQVLRYAKADGRKVFVTDSAAAAFDYLGLPYHSL
jgi:hypothetical protein